MTYTPQQPLRAHLFCDYHKERSPEENPVLWQEYLESEDEMDEDIELTPTPREETEQSVLPYLEDIRDFRFPREQIDGYNRYQVITKTWEQGNGKMVSRTHDYNLSEGLLRFRSFSRAVPDQRIPEKELGEKGKAFYQGIPRGFKGAVKENIRFQRRMFPDSIWGVGVEYRKGKNRGVNMKLVNKELK